MFDLFNKTNYHIWLGKVRVWISILKKCSPQANSLKAVLSQFALLKDIGKLPNPIRF